MSQRDPDVPTSTKPNPPRFEPCKVIGVGRVVIADRAGDLWQVDAESGTMRRVEVHVRP